MVATHTIRPKDSARKARDRANAVIAIRTNAYNWTLSVNWLTAKDRYEHLEFLRDDLDHQWRAAVAAGASETEWDMFDRLSSVEAQLTGIADAAEFRGWTE